MQCCYAMLTRRISRELREAVACAGLTLWEVARRSETNVVDVAKALGGKSLLPADTLNAIGEALGFQLSIVPIGPAARPIGPVPSVVDLALQRFEMESPAATPESHPYVLALKLHSLLPAPAAPDVAKFAMREFLSCAGELFRRVIVVTTRSHRECRQSAELLAVDGSAPQWFASVDMVCMKSAYEHSDLSAAYGLQPEEAIVFATVLEDYVLARHEDRWTTAEEHRPWARAYEEGISSLLQMIVDTYFAPRRVDGSVLPPRRR